MVDIYSFKKKFYTALGIFSFFALCGFLSAPINAHTGFLNQNAVEESLDFSLNGIQPMIGKENGSIEIIITGSNAPYKILIYSTTIPVKEYQVKRELTINNLSVGEYMIVVSGENNEYKSKTITLREE